jgi:hypothetical protein
MAAIAYWLPIAEKKNAARRRVQSAANVLRLFDAMRIGATLEWH